MLPSIWRDNSIFGENLFDDWFGFPTERDFRNIEKKLYGKNAAHVMKTDVTEHDDHYEIAIDLPVRGIRSRSSGRCRGADRWRRRSGRPP